MNTLTKEQAVRFISSRQLISAPGKYNVQVINTPNFWTDDKGNDKVIINLKATTSKLVESAKSDLRDGDFDAAANSNLTFSPFADSAYIPSKGDHVSIMVGYVDARDGSQVLAVTACTEIATSSASKVNLGDEFANDLDAVTESNDEVIAE